MGGSRCGAMHIWCPIVYTRARFYLGVHWLGISRRISRGTIFMTHIRGLTTLLITTPEPPSNSKEWATSWLRKL